MLNNITTTQKDHLRGGAVGGISGALYAIGGAIPCE